MYQSSKDGLLTPLFGQNGSRFVLGIWVVGKLLRAGGDGALEDSLLQVVKHGRVLFSEESHGYTTLTSTTRTTDTMNVVCWKRKSDTIRLISVLLNTKQKKYSRKKEASYLQCS